jgi:hypothetical protein
VLDVHLLQNGDIDWAGRPDKSRYPPSGPGNYLTHLARRNDQVIEPRRSRVTMMNTEAELPWKSPPAAVQLMVPPVIGSRCLVRVSGFGDNPGRRGCQRMESPEKPSRPTRVAEQPEVVTKHDDGVECTEPATDSRNRTHARIASPAKLARFHRERRDVNRDDLVTASLQMQRNPARSAAHVEDPATDLPHGSSLGGGPLVEWGKVGWSACRKIEPVIVTFDDFRRPQALVVGVDQPADRV